PARRGRRGWYRRGGPDRRWWDRRGRRSGVARGSGSRRLLRLLVSEAARDGTVERASTARGVDRSVGERIPAPRDLRSGQGNELHRLPLARLESDGVAGRHVEPAPVRLRAVAGAR